ncbi:sulfatase [Flammeovirgaceae bacterium SG7u.111]|nr:sulfatase [Flammeovirgaceae bacterium SG7u.132]WPO37619.1 sulfatase [Flammeovirgaceae bacterium SG7u.111]
MKPITHLLGLFLVFSIFSCQQEKTKKPNIIYIMSDDHTTQAFGVYGSRLAGLNPTPTLDKLAADGMYFTNAFCSNSICTPSRATILTGQFGHVNGVYDLDGHLDESKQYLPKEMKKLGYETAMIGKWHLKEEPAAFDFYKVLKLQGDYFDPTFRVRGEKEWPNNTEKHEGHSTDVITDLTLEWLKGRDSEKPFFLMHHYKAPHDMFEYAPRYEDYLADVEIPEPESLFTQPEFGSEATRGKNDSLIHRIGTSISSRHVVRNYVQDFKIDTTLSEVEQTKAAYQAYLKKYLRCVKGVDDNLARLFKHLEETGEMENTIIIYTGDQGFMLGEHDYMDKRWMYEEAMRMPLIVRYPEKIKPGTVSTAMVSNCDYAPFMIELAGGKTPEYMQGKSLVPLMDGTKPADWRKSVYYRYWMHLMHHDNPAHFGIRTEDYKLIFYYAQPRQTEKIGTPSMPWKKNSFMIEPTPVAWELYDLKNDPNEVVNLYGKEGYEEITQSLKAQLKELRAEVGEDDSQFPHIQEVVEAYWDK